MKNFKINERILYLIENQFNANQKKFAESIGFAPQVVFNIVAGRKTKPSFDVLNAIISTNDNISANWLLTGDGDMLKKDLSLQPVSNRLDGIPLIPLDAMAGFGVGESVILEVDCERFVVPAFKGADFLITVKGSSMYPKYSSGDIVACKKLPLDDLFFQWNKVYVLDTVQGALVKRIKKGSGDDSILIYSDNLEYESFELHRSQINAVALVIGVIRVE